VRRVTVLLIGAVVIARSTGAAAAAPPVSIDVHHNESGSSIAFHVRGGRLVPRLTMAARAHSVGPVVYPVYEPELVTQGGGFCVSYGVNWVATPGVQAEQTAAAEPKWELLLGQFAPCPGVNLPAGVGTVNPQVAAAAYWANQGENPLLVPSPRIRPGYALAGETAFLETGGTTGQAFVDPTGAGPLDISATGQFWVDWGDGSGLSGPYATAGGPWPDGTITHVWTSAGTFTVTVFERWSARWALGGRGGALAGLRTEGAIPAFQVEQVVSVRNR
jgi:hypothetical protein